MVTGKFLTIGTEYVIFYINCDKLYFYPSTVYLYSFDLSKAFGDPCLGVRKVLKIFYCTRGFQGAMRVREKDGCLVAAVEIGFEPDIGGDTPPEQKRPVIGKR